MARNTITHITDDIDGSKDATAVTFAYDGKEYSIDLSKKNKAALEKALQPYMQAGVRVTRRSSPGRRTAATSNDTSDIRAWAKAKGLDVSDRGRIPKAIVDQYRTR